MTDREFCTKHGFYALPLRSGSKAALEAGWTKRSTQAVNSIPPEHNLGIHMGKSGLLGLDVDIKTVGTTVKRGDLTVARLEAEFGPLPRTLKVRTPSGGLHLYFRTPYAAGEIGQKFLADIEIQVDNHYLVSAGAVINNGKYEVIDDSPVGCLPEKWVTGLLEKYQQKVGMHVYLKPATRTATDTETGVNDARTVSRARAYVAKMPPAIEGERGSDQMMKVCTVLLNGFALSYSTAYNLITEKAGYNDRCTPAWSEREIEHKLNSVTSSSTPGWLLFDDPTTLTEAEQKILQIIDKLGAAELMDIAKKLDVTAEIKYNTGYVFYQDDAEYKPAAFIQTQLFGEPTTLAGKIAAEWFIRTYMKKTPRIRNILGANLVASSNPS